MHIPPLTPNFRRLLILCCAGGTALLLLIGVLIWPAVFTPKPVDAPEEALILQAQRTMPFQILIPAYLPAGMRRKDIKIEADLISPEGEPMVRLTYNHPLGVSLTLTEWLVPEGEGTETVISGAQMCTCMCQNATQCSSNHLMVDKGSLRIMGETSDAALLSPDHVRVILESLSPASGLLTHSQIQSVPLTSSLPAAEEIPVGEDGVQEVVLVVSPNGYTPVHFSIRKNLPARLIFRQLGNVGCGNELIFNWGETESQTLVLASPEESQTLEFIPRQTGDYLFQCPHGIYQGVMTVIE